MSLARNMGDSWSLAKPAWQSPWASPWGEEVGAPPRLFPFACGYYSCSVSLLFLEQRWCFYSCMLSFTCIFKSQAQRSWVCPCALSSLSHPATGFTHCLFLPWAVTKEVPVLLVFPKASDGRSPPRSMRSVSLLCVCSGVLTDTSPCFTSDRCCCQFPIDAVVKMF